MINGVENIIFDLGGVLVGLDSERCAAAFRRIGAGNIVPYVSEHRVEDLFIDAETGRITRQEFCEQVRELSHCAANDDEIAWAWGQLLTGIPACKIERLLELRSNYRLFLLSNTNAIHWELCAGELFNHKGYGVGDYFERVFLSYELREVKPSAEIFADTLRMAGINAGETLFIDDSLENCEAAQSLGINVLHAPNGDEWLAWTINER